MTKQDTVASYATRIARVHDHIANHLDDVLDLDRLADVAALSRWHFLRIYREMTGETTAGTVRRLRLHRAAVELVQRDTPLAKVARRAGYGSLAAFARAFAADYGAPPGTYRLRRRLDPPLPLHHHKESIMYQVSIEPFDGVRLAAITHRGDYQQIGTAFERVVAWAMKSGLGRDRLRSFGVYYDDPQSVPVQDLRAEAGIAVASDISCDGDVHAVDIPAGPCATVLHKGPYAELPRSYQFLFREWLPTSGQVPRDFPCFEEYLNDPRTLPPTEWLTRVYLPLAVR
jgi:AraC family transcriptional regulator